MKFVLFRHAQKGVMPFEDPELSPRGFDQAQKITELVKNAILPAPTELCVSPKRRTSQTFYPVAKEYGISIKIKADLDQRLQDESSADFRRRVQNFISLISETDSSTTQKVVYACTHYDWIEEAMTLINCDKDLTGFEFSHWAPTQFLIFEIENSIWKFIKKGDAK